MTKGSASVSLGCRLGAASAQPDEREWWIGNGIGGYAGGTVGGALTRRYHALLVAPLVEEGLKAGWLEFQVGTRRTAFLVDATIVAFATGAGFCCWPRLTQS